MRAQALWWRVLGYVSLAIVGGTFGAHVAADTLDWRSGVLLLVCITWAWLMAHDDQERRT